MPVWEAGMDENIVFLFFLQPQNNKQAISQYNTCLTFIHTIVCLHISNKQSLIPAGH
jgi:hypothetical protein